MSLSHTSLITGMLETQQTGWIVLGFDKTSFNFLPFTQSVMSGGTPPLLITLATPSLQWSMVVGASWCGNAFLIAGTGNLVRVESMIGEAKNTTMLEMLRDLSLLIPVGENSSVQWQQQSWDNRDYKTIDNIAEKFKLTALQMYKTSYIHNIKRYTHMQVISTTQIEQNFWKHICRL